MEKEGVGVDVMVEEEMPTMSIGVPESDVTEQQPQPPVEPVAESQPVSADAADDTPLISDDDIYDITPPNVVTEREAFDREKGDSWDHNHPMETFDGAIEDIVYANRHQGEEFKENPENQQRIRSIMPTGFGYSALRREGSHWEASKRVGKQLIGMGTPSIDTPSNVLRGNMAQTILRRVANLGVNIICVLPRSCIYLEITPPGDDEIIAYDYSLLTERSGLGMSTAGLLLSASSGTFVAANIELALSHVTNTNVQNLGGDKVASLMARIDPLDYPIIMNALMAARYPGGYPWVLKCIKPGCDGRVEGRLNFGRTQRIDFSMLTDEQLTMLATKNRVITDAELEKYRKAFRVSDKSRFEYSPGVAINLTTGNLMAYADSAVSWKTTIETSQTKALTSYATDAERKTFTDAQIQAHYMRKFAHFVDSIEVTVGETVNTISELDDILEALTSLSKNIDRALAFEQHVIAWIEDNTMAIIGHPAYSCDVCNHVHSPYKEGSFRNFVPLAIDRIFFIVSRLLSRRLVAQSKTPSET